MDNYKLLTEALDSFFSDENLQVLVLKGSWGIGKTFFWEKYIKQKKEKKELSLLAYSYISLFGLSSVLELKSKIFENGEPLLSSEGLEKKINSQENLLLKQLAKLAELAKFQEKNIPKLLSQVAHFGWKEAEEKNILKLLSHSRELPLVKGFATTMQSIEYGLVMEYLICLDDIERKENGVSIRQIMGVIDELKLKKKCKVVLIFNEQTLKREDKDEFDRFREKIVDVEIEFNPLPEENLSIVFKKTDIYFDRLNYILSQVIKISNIRVFKKIQWAINKVWEELEKHNDAIKIDVATHIAIFCTFYFSENFLSFSKLCETTKDNSWLLPKDDKNLDEQYIRISYILRQAEFSSKKYDACIIDLLTKGYLSNPNDLRNALVEQGAEIESENIKTEIKQVSDLYLDSFEDNSQELKNKIRAILNSYNLGRINLGSFYQLINMLEILGEDVSNYINEYVGIRGSQLLEMQRGLVGIEIRNEQLIHELSRLREGTKRNSINEILLYIMHNQSWNQDDIKYLSSLTAEEIYSWIKSKPGDIYYKIKLGLLTFQEFSGSNPDESERYKSIVTNTRNALKRLANEVPLNKVRLEKLYNIQLSDGENADNEV